MPYSFAASSHAIAHTQSGRERNMYPHLRDILIHTLGHKPDTILVDTQSADGIGMPDLCVRVPIGLGSKEMAKSAKAGLSGWADWAVFEVKDETGAFRDPATREAIFAEKSKYIGVLTAWFVMVDPEVFVARPVTMRSQLVFDPDADIVLRWADVNEAEFKRLLTLLLAANAGVNAALQAFREGDISKIAVVKLRMNGGVAISRAQQRRVQQAHSDFFDSVTKSTALLQHACMVALEAQRPTIEKIEQQAQDFASRWHGYTISFAPFRLLGQHINGPEAARQHDTEVTLLRGTWLKNPALTKLALQWLPAFHARMGSKKKDHHFAIETANLILARVLLIRFFEDHGFFGEKRYVCNGGVRALQEYMRYYEKGYEQVLKLAYEKSHAVYAAVFDEMDLDWVLGVENEQLSRSLEISMMLLSRFDFTTVKGDILTGIYDRFLDPKKRKEMGEFYTPPSVARYLIRRLGLAPGDSVIDPACGSGTFLLEAYAHMVGDAVESGLATQEDVQTTLNQLYGCDLNPFSATIAQVQMLWHLLPHRHSFFKTHFPQIQIADRNNSLKVNGLSDQYTLFAEMNRPIHAAVIGNPPYVRPERNTQTLSAADNAFYSDLGTTDKNLFGLFIYKALRGLCRPALDASAQPQEAGKVAFVVPLSFCDNDDNAALRAQFQLGGSFTLIEIIDLEVIAPYVFDAAVNPIVLIAQNRPARASDKVTLRQAGPDCVSTGLKRSFDLDRATRHEFSYEDVWDNISGLGGRILTRITPAHLPILKQLRGLPQLETAAQKFWVKKSGARIVAWQVSAPAARQGEDRDDGDDGEDRPGKFRWEQQTMIRRGAVFRNQRPCSDNPSLAFDFFKGENISAGLIEGKPAAKDINIDAVSDNSLWRFRDILPKRGYAFLQITLGLSGAPFDPSKIAFLDTATLFFPRDDLSEFPFDLAMLSRVYQYYFGLALRQGAVSELWSHLYPRNLRKLPWSEQLAVHGGALEALRPRYLELCRAVHNRRATLLTALQQLGCVTWQAALRTAQASVVWPESVDQGELLVIAPASRHAPSQAAAGSRGTANESTPLQLLQLGPSLHDFIEVSDPTAALQLAAVLSLWEGESLSRSQILRLDVPRVEQLGAWRERTARYDAGGSQADLDSLFDQIDSLVGPALGLSVDDIAAIQHAMRDDPFLKHIRPNLPYSGRAQRGLSDSLASADRYVGETS